MTRRALLLCAVMLTVSCASLRTQTLAVSGETLAQTGDQFVNTATLLTPACNAKTLPKWETICPAFKAFGLKFKESWPLATGLWYAARKANDPKIQASAESAIRALRAELTTFTTAGRK